MCFFSTSSFATNGDGPKYKINWLLAHDPIELFEEAAQFFADKVFKETNGQVLVNVVSNHKGYSHTQVISMVQGGHYEMTQTYTVGLGEVYNDLWVLDLPYIFDGHEHAERVLNGEVGQKLLAGLSNHGLEGLTFTYSGGFRVIPSSGKTLEKLEDFKGFRVRTGQSPVAKIFFEFLGAVPVVSPAGWGALQARGLINGAETTYPRFYTTEQSNLSKVINDTKHSLFLTSIVVNQDFFNKLPLEFQNIIRSAAIEAGVLERQASIDDGERVRNKAKAEGIQIVELPESEIERIKKEIRPLYKERFYPMFGDLIDQIIKERYSVDKNDKEVVTFN